MRHPELNVKKEFVWRVRSLHKLRKSLSRVLRLFSATSIWFSRSYEEEKGVRNDVTDMIVQVG